MTDSPNATVAADNSAEFADAMSKIIRDYRIAMSEFNDGMKRREELSLKVGQRQIWLHRLGLASILVVFMLGAFLIVTLKTNTQTLTAQVEVMNQNMLAVATQVHEVQQIMQEVGTNIHGINAHLQNMPEFNQLAVGFQDDLAAMQLAMTQVNTALVDMNSTVNTAQTDVQAINEKIADLSKTNSNSANRAGYSYYRY